MVLASRKRRFHNPNRNLSAIAVYTYLEAIARYGGTIDPAITDLGLRARFSQHIITEPELEPLRRYASSFAAETYGALNLARRVSFKYFRALI